MPARKTTTILIILLIAFFAGFLINIQHIQPVPNLGDLEPNNLINSGYALLLTGLTVFIAAGFGRTLLSLFDLSSWSFLERIIIELPVGLAALGYLEFGLGLIGLINPIFQIGLLIIISILSFNNLIAITNQFMGSSPKIKSHWHETSLLNKFFMMAGLLAILFALCLSLTPPWEYDGLMYHLQGPRLFLNAGKIIPIPENFFTYFPSTWEMVYMLGMGLGSDIFPRLIHFTATILLMLATYVFGKKLLGQLGGWTAAALLLGMPIVLLWGGLAYNDVALSLFQFLAFWMALLWKQNRKTKYLVLAGILQGCALGIKYTALPMAGILLIMILFLSLFEKRKPIPWKIVFSNLIVFGGFVFLVAFPWYLKNLLWTGNPVFPFYLSQEVIHPDVLNIYMDYLGSFGTGNRWSDFLLLPINLYLKPGEFGTILTRWDRPNPLFLLTFAYPFIRRTFEKSKRQMLDIILAVVTSQFIYWAISSQQNRFLLSIYPHLCILTSAILIQILTRMDKVSGKQILFSALIGGLVFSSLAVLGSFFLGLKPYQVILNRQTKSSFLMATIKNHEAIEYINQQLPENSTVFLLLDGGGYYCQDEKCAPDVLQASWTALIQRTTNIEEVSDWFSSHQITHILLTSNAIDYIVNGHDQNHLHKDAVDFFINQYAPQCATQIYENDNSQLFQIVSPICN